MNLFDNMLKGDESLFLNEHMLSYEYQPKLILHRENKQHYMAQAIKPLLEKRNGKSLFIFGEPGVGKTVCSKHVLNELMEKTDIPCIYINCWKKDTPHKIFTEICHQINYKFTHNKSSDELFTKIKEVLNKNAVVIVLDEADKISDYQALYNLVEDIYKKTIFLVSNRKGWLVNLDQRLKSRLNLDELEFKPYSVDETFDILKERRKYAFVQDIFPDDVLELIANKTFQLGDVRTGLYLMKEAGNIAENKLRKKITLGDAKEAMARLKEFKVKSSQDLDVEGRYLMDLVKENSGKTINEIYEKYKEKYDKSYRTFQRKIEDLHKNNLISMEETTSEKGGKTFILKF